MKSNKILLTLLLAVFLLTTLSFFVSAEVVANNVTIVLPASSGIISGTTYKFNCSIQQLATYKADNWTRVRVYLQSASLTANTTESLVTGWITNSTAYDLNGTFSAWQDEDGTDYTFKCQINNGTNYLNVTRTGITVNNTIPDSATSASPTSTSSSTINFSVSVVANETTACILYFPRTKPNSASSSQSMVHGGNTCSLQFTNVPEGIYDWYVRTSDGSDVTDTALFTTNMEVTTSAGKATQMIAEGEATSEGGATLSVASGGLLGKTGTWIVVGIVAILVIVVIAKRRKR